MGANDESPLYQNIAYQLRGVNYLPHYRNESIFVGPSYPTQSRIYSATELVNAGANKIVMNLWSRGKVGVVDRLNP
jgi:hypothetical protein